MQKDSKHKSSYSLYFRQSQIYNRYGSRSCTILLKALSKGNYLLRLESLPAAAWGISSHSEYTERALARSIQHTFLF